MNTSLLVSGAMALDIVFFVLLAGGLIFGVCRGFVAGVFRIAGVVIAGVVAATFCTALQNGLELWFGLTTKLAGVFGGQVWSAKLAYVLINVICFIALWLISWLLCRIFGRIGKSLVSKYKPMRLIDRFLGGLLGLFISGVTIFLLLSICYWISSAAPAVGEFIESSTVVGKIYAWPMFQEAVHFTFEAIMPQG